MSKIFEEPKRLERKRIEERKKVDKASSCIKRKKI
jgi:hypothetical protein